VSYLRIQWQNPALSTFFAVFLLLVISFWAVIQEYQRRENKGGR
jgi:hypothetical protein